jgi:hypothetical protein
MRGPYGGRNTFSVQLASCPDARSILELIVCDEVAASRRPNIEGFRDALTQHAAEWKQTLRPEPKVARLLIRRLIGPLEL